MVDKTMNALMYYVRNLVDITTWYSDDGEGSEALFCNACDTQAPQHREDCPLVELCELLGWPVPTR